RPLVLRPAGRRARVQDPRVADQPAVAGVLAAVPRRRRGAGDHRPAPGLRGAFDRMASASDGVMLRTVGLRKRVGGVPALGGGDLAVARGDVRGIIGANGAGKTTLFNLITGDLAHDSGAIYFDDAEVSGLAPHELCRRGMGRTFQITSIFRRLSAFENVQTA